MNGKKSTEKQLLWQNRRLQQLLQDRVYLFDTGGGSVGVGVVGSCDLFAYKRTGGEPGAG